MKEFNTTATCVPEKHYMVNLDQRLSEIRKQYIEKDKYFVINRGRQYGKTTMLLAMSRMLQSQYDVISISFEWAEDFFSDSSTLVRELIRMIAREMRLIHMSTDIITDWEAGVDSPLSFNDLDEKITQLCMNNPKPVILIIDEVDRVSNMTTMLTFLALLRDKYIRRTEGRDYSFKNVILAGVYDIKNLKHRMRPKDTHHYNSPWNIATNFDIDMAFSVKDIEQMLIEYRTDHGLAFEEQWFAEQIYQYTSGYPFLVSKICQLLDTKVATEYGTLEDAWKEEGFQRAIKLLLNERNTLFDDLNKKLDENRELYQLVRRIVIGRELIPYTVLNNSIQLGMMFGWLRENNARVMIANRIFETLIYDKMIQEYIV